MLKGYYCWNFNTTNKKLVIWDVGVFVLLGYSCPVAGELNHLTEKQIKAIRGWSLICIEIVAARCVSYHRPLVTRAA